MPVALEDLTGLDKAAVLLITLGVEKTAQIFKFFKEEEQETLTFKIAATKTVNADIKDAVLTEFYQICLAQQYIVEGGLPYAQQILERALGEAKAREVINKLTVMVRVTPFDALRKADASQIFNFIQHELPQMIALVLSHLKPQQAAQILTDLPPEKQADVAWRIAMLERTPPDVVKAIEAELEKKLSALSMEGALDEIGGVGSLVDILNLVNRETEKNIMDTLEGEDPDLTDEIKRKMFVFEDIVTLSNRDIQTVMRQPDLEAQDLAISLKNAPEAVVNIVMANRTKRQAAMLQEDIEILGPIRRSVQEEAQQRIVGVIRRLQDAGEITVARGGGDDILV